MTLHIKRF